MLTCFSTVRNNRWRESLISETYINQINKEHKHGTIIIMNGLMCRATPNSGKNRTRTGKRGSITSRNEVSRSHSREGRKQQSSYLCRDFLSFRDKSRIMQFLRNKWVKTVELLYREDTIGTQLAVLYINKGVPNSKVDSYTALCVWDYRQCFH